MPRPQNTAQRREQIVRGLMQAMAEHGYAGATIPKIAKAAGLTPGLIHYHFKSKGEILLALIASLKRGLERRVSARVDERRTAEERLRAYLDALVSTGPDADPKAVAAWVVVSAEALRSEEVNDAWRVAVEDILGELAHCVKQALDVPEDDEDVEYVAITLFASVQGAYQLAAAAPDLIPPGSYASSLWTMALALLDKARRQRGAP